MSSLSAEDGSQTGEKKTVWTKRRCEHWSYLLVDKRGFFVGWRRKQAR